MSMRNNKQGKNMKVKATSYTGKQLTYLGTQARYGVIATDPKVIPLGSKVYIPYFDKVFIAEDTGSAIKGNKIDIYVNSHAEALAWGVRYLPVNVVNQ